MTLHFLSVQSLPLCWETRKRVGKATLHRLYRKLCLLSCQSSYKVELQDRNISMDRLYTSISLANWLLGKKITCRGTLNHNRQGIPTELKNTSKREEFLLTCHYESVKKDLCLLSYTVKTKSSGKKNVLLLSAIRPLDGIARDDNK